MEMNSKIVENFVVAYISIVYFYCSSLVACQRGVTLLKLPIGVIPRI